MADATKEKQSKNEFSVHRDQTEGQIGRLNLVFDMIGQEAKGKVCPAIDGILKKGK
jgi:ferritin-like metal-binding protein YciE